MPPHVAPRTVRSLAPTLLLALVLALIGTGPSRGAEPAPHVVTSVIVGERLPGPSGRIQVGVRMQHLPGWHTYWQNPGDAGMPTSIVWHLAAGWSASEIEWPAPERLPSGPLASYGYVGELVLPMVLTPPPDWDGRAAAHLSASVSWLACSASCIPEKAELSLDLPAPADPRAVPLLRHFLNRTPEAFAFTTAQVRRSADRFELVLSPAAGGEFFPEMEELIDPGEPPRVHREGHATVWSTKLGERGRHLPPGAHILGVWIEKGRRPRRVDALLVAS